MAWTAEEKVQIAEALVVYQLSRSVVNRLLSGRITKAENKLLMAMVRAAGRGVARAPGTLAAVGVGAARLAGTVAMRHPLLALGGAIYIAHENQDEIRQLLQQGYELIPERVGIVDPGEFGQIRPGPLMVTVDPRTVKRAISKANRAVKYAMSVLKRGTKAATGAPPGKLPAKAFTMATKAAGLANPKTKSRIGKAKTKLNKLAKKIRSWW